tara:strand:- start:5028 stop:6962 length:1935 start_codon:yes stop_codon:yes gene_type:complete
MCGIFGINFKSVNKIDQGKIKEDIKVFLNLSKARGQDTFGVSMSNGENEKIFKLNTDPSEGIRRKDYKNYISLFFKSILENNPLLINGQTRLVTNGTKFLPDNNQPIITKNIIGTHNGIIINTNYKSDSENAQKKNLEGYKVKSDSLLLFENLSDLFSQSRENFLQNLDEYLNYIEGNYSIYFRVPDIKLNFLSSNCGSLYYLINENHLIYASEKNIIKSFLAKSKYKFDFKKEQIKKILDKNIIFTDELKIVEKEILNKNYFLKKNHYEIFDNITQQNLRREDLQKCTKCILPSTYPFINFDKNGVSNYFRNYKKQEYLGEDALMNILDKYRSKNSEPDCVVGLSGGRDSSYGLHLLKTKFKMNPIAFTFDWGLTTDISRVNQAKLCGKLGVEHIIRSANIKQKRNYVRNNIMAWLKRPHLGMLPVIQAGDKPFMDYGDILAKENKIKLVIQFTGYQLEQREFFLGFAGIDQKLQNNQRMSSYNLLNKLKMFYFYSTQTLINPSYINLALLDNFQGFLSSFIKKENSLHFYNYVKWDEEEIIDTLKNEYNWSNDLAYGKNQWRMGDGQTTFNNFIYYTLAGFSEFDNFRSNQICEGLLTRENALLMAKEDNSFKYDVLKNFSEIIGFNLDDVLSKIISLPRLY